MGGKSPKAFQRVPRAHAWAGVERLGVREGETTHRIALRTVQHVLERAVMAVVREPIVLMGASRTDSGVHARGQVAAFTCSGDVSDEVRDEECDANATPIAIANNAEHAPTTPSATELAPVPSAPRGMGWPLSRGTDRLLRAINSRLPDDVQVIAANVADHDFNPVHGATSKAYSYTLHVSAKGGVRPMWDRRYVHQVWDALDVDAMNRAAHLLVGEHDFVSFAAAGHGRVSTVRTIFACSVIELVPTPDGRRVRIDVTGSGFLWNMVRIIGGTLVDVGRGRKKADDISQIIKACNRSQAGPTLPPTGLCLEWIKYEVSK